MKSEGKNTKRTELQRKSQNIKSVEIGYATFCPEKYLVQTNNY